MAGEVGPIRVPFWRRWLHAVASVFSDHVRERTPYEVELEAATAQLRAEAADRETLVRSLRVELAETKSLLKISETEVKALTEVITRDRKRVEAETAAYARKVAESEAGPG